MRRHTCVIDGEEWSVFDVRPVGAPALDPALADGWLCFERGPKRRRLYPIPEAWELMSNVDVCALWAQAKPALPLS